MGVRVDGLQISVADPIDVSCGNDSKEFQSETDAQQKQIFDS
jgi:hypothetical protein